MLGYTHWIKDIVFFASELPGDGGKDWGYTQDRNKAIRLSPYWVRRFRADQRRCNRIAFFAC